MIKDLTQEERNRFTVDALQKIIAEFAAGQIDVVGADFQREANRKAVQPLVGNVEYEPSMEFELRLILRNKTDQRPRMRDAEFQEMLSLMQVLQVQPEYRHGTECLLRKFINVKP